MSALTISGPSSLSTTTEAQIYTEWRCDGCQEGSPVPLDLGETRWEYRVNELYARGHDQGTITVLLTLYAMNNAWGRSSDREGIGYYPGVRLSAKSGASVPVEQVDDIDLVAMRGSRLVLAECKESAELRCSRRGTSPAII